MSFYSYLTIGNYCCVSSIVNHHFNLFHLFFSVIVGINIIIISFYINERIKKQDQKDCPKLHHFYAAEQGYKSRSVTFQTSSCFTCSLTLNNYEQSNQSNSGMEKEYQRSSQDLFLATLVGVTPFSISQGEELPISSKFSVLCTSSVGIMC